MVVLTWFLFKIMTAILYFGGQKSVPDGLIIFNNGGDQKGGFVLY